MNKVSHPVAGRERARCHALELPAQHKDLPLQGLHEPDVVHRIKTESLELNNFLRALWLVVREANKLRHDVPSVTQLFFHISR